MKKYSGVLMALVAATLLLLTAPRAAAAVDNSGISGKFAAGTTQAQCPVCEKTVTWKALPSGGTVTLKNGDHYYAAADSGAQIYAPTDSSATGCLHLNGKQLFRPDGFVLGGNRGTLNVMGEGIVTGGRSGGNATLSVPAGCIFNIYGGTYKLTANGSNLMGVGGTVNFYGGTMDASGCAKDWYPGCVYLYGAGEFNLYGGTLKNGYSTGRGGNIGGDEGTVNLYGGTVAGGTAMLGGNIGIAGKLRVKLEGTTVSNGTATEMGGNISVRGGGFYMTGGTIAGGKAPIGGNLLIENVGVNLDGGKIENGTATQTGGNLHIGGANVGLENVTISGGTARSTSTGGGNIYLSADGKVVQVSGTVSGGKATTNGGNVYVYKGVYKLQNGKITGGSAKKGGAVFLFGGDGIASTFEMTDGTVSGGAIDAPGKSGILTIRDGNIGSVINGWAKIEIYGGTFVNDLSQYVVGKVMYKTSSGKYITFEDNGMAAIVGSKVYETVEQAFKKASATEPLALLASYDGTLVVDRDMTIDLNGYELGGIELKSGKLKILNEKKYPGSVGQLTGDLSKVTLVGATFATSFQALTNTGSWTVAEGVYGPITNQGSMAVSGGVFGPISGGSMTVSGGVFGSDISGSLVGDVKCCKTTEGTWIVYGEEDGALVDGTKYATLSEAMATKPYGKTVVLLKDCPEQISITEPEQKTVTLDLNGCTLASLTVGENSQVVVDIRGGGKITKLEAMGQPGLLGGDYADAFGTVISHAEWTIAAGTYGDIEANATLIITGGTFLGNITGRDVQISGGSFAQDVTGWLAEDMPFVQKDGMYLIGVEPPEIPWRWIVIGTSGTVLLAVVILAAVLLLKKPRKEA